MPPVMLWVGNISAGFPSAAEGYEDQPLDLHTFIVKNPAATFFYHVKGDALCQEHVCDGSILVVDRSVMPRPGKLVLIEDAGEFVVCRFKHRPMLVVGVVIAAVIRY